MIEARGKVAAQDGDHALVQIEDAGCGRCHEEGGCGGHSIGRALCSTPRLFRLPNPQKLPVGSRVNVLVESDAVRRGATVAYLVPLLSLLLGAILGSWLAGEAGALVGALSGLALAWVFLRRAGRRENRSLQPYIE